jgi:hypothetical protein
MSVFDPTLQSFFNLGFCQKQRQLVVRVVGPKRPQRGLQASLGCVKGQNWRRTATCRSPQGHTVSYTTPRDMIDGSAGSGHGYGSPAITMASSNSPPGQGPEDRAEDERTQPRRRPCCKRKRKDRPRACDRWRLGTSPVKWPHAIPGSR